MYLNNPSGKIFTSASIAVFVGFPAAMASAWFRPLFIPACALMLLGGVVMAIVSILDLISIKTNN
jgi:hypothetical protein